MSRRAELLFLTHAALPAAFLAPPPWGVVIGASWAVMQAAITAEILRPRSQIFVPNTWQGPDVPRVALTFDDGPHEDDTPALLDALDAAGCRATFFFVSRRARALPALVRRAADAGHDVGAHGATHPWWFSLAGPRRLREEVAGAAAEIADVVGAPVRWYRPPMGHKNVFLGRALEGTDLRVVTWSVRAFDTLGRAPEVVRAGVARGLRPGAIVLLHENVRRRPLAAAAALPGIVEDARARGLEPVSLRSLLPAT